MICITHKKECTSQRSAYLIKKHNITRERVLNLLRYKKYFLRAKCPFCFSASWASNNHTQFYFIRTSARRHNFTHRVFSMTSLSSLRDNNILYHHHFLLLTISMIQVLSMWRFVLFH